MVKVKIRNERLIEKRQSQICKGAIKVFRQKGFHASSIRDIAKASNISLGSLYDYIEKKEDIFFLVHKDIHQHIHTRLIEGIGKSDDTVEQLIHVFKGLFDLSIEKKQEILFIFNETRYINKKDLVELQEYERQVIDTFKSLIDKGVEEGTFTCRQPDIFSNVLLLIGSLIPLRGWRVLPMFHKDEIFFNLIYLILNGLNTRKDDSEIMRMIEKVL